MKKIKAVIFDLDGTLVDSITDLSHAVHYAATKQGYHVSDNPADYIPWIGNGAKKLIERALGENKVTPEEFELISGDFDAYYKAHVLDCTKPYDGVVQLLEDLKNASVRLAVLTNKPHVQTMQIIDALFPNTFDFVLGKKDGAPLKPDPSAALSFIEKWGFDSESCAFCGDSDVDILTARKAGMLPLGVSWGYRSTDELVGAGAYKIASRPQDIKKFLIAIDNSIL